MDWIITHNKVAVNNINILCIADGDTVSMVINTLKQLNEGNNNVMLVIVATSENREFQLDELKRITSSVKIVEANEYRPTEKPVFDVLYSTVASSQISHIYCYGGVYTIKETLEYLNNRPQIDYSCVLDTTKSKNAKLKGIFNVSFCRKSKYICVEGDTLDANYKNFESFVERFASPSSVSQEQHLEQA